MADGTLGVTRSDRGQLIAHWDALDGVNTGAMADMGGSRDRTVSFVGTWDSATAILQGSNDGSVWFTLNDYLGVDISATGNAMFLVAETPRYIRPVTSGGGASTNVDVIVVGN